MSSTAIEFDVDRHEYRLDGRLVPSVTQILRVTGRSTDFEAIKAMSWRRAAAIDWKRQVGKTLHADSHAFDDNDLVLETVDPDVRPYLDAWATFRENSRVVPICRERIVYHQGDRRREEYCGMLDGIFLTASGRRALLDAKTGDPKNSGCQFQTAAYQMAFEFENPLERIHERWAVQLTPGRKIPYRVTPYLDWSDQQEWRRIVSEFYAKAA